MKTRTVGLAAFALASALMALVFVPTTNAKDRRTVLTQGECKASCQAGLTRCQQSGKCSDGRSCNRDACFKELGDCQTILCGHLPTE